MPETVELPGGWEQELDRIQFDSFMDREYTTLVFTNSLTEQKLMIHDIQEPNSFEGWGYLVHVTDPKHGKLDIVEDLESAREIAVEFMSGHSE